VDTIADIPSVTHLKASVMTPRTDPSPATAFALRLVLLEHDETLREQVLLPGLRHCGFEVEPVSSTTDLQRVLLNAAFDLCVLDRVLSHGDGVSLPLWLRNQYPQMGVLVLSAQADPFDHLRALNEGADAYLGKPVPVEIIAATVTSIARRMQHRPARLPDRACAQWQLQSDGWCLVAPDGAQTTLTISERRLVRVLWENNGSLVARETLMAAVTNDQGAMSSIDPHGLDVLLYRLRRKVQNRTGQALPLEVVRGAGYILHRTAHTTGNGSDSASSAGQDSG